jgi:hypothetical protein
LPAHNSDHNPLLLNTAIPVPTFPKLFRFEEFWTHDPTCEVVIQEAWSTPFEGSSSYCFSNKLKITKQSIKYWNKHCFGDIRSKLGRTLKLLDAVQRDYPSDSNLALELHLHSLVDECLLQEESLWKSKSRELWLTSVDLNTKFFHTSTLIRRRRNSIDTLHSPQLGLLINRRAIGDCFVNNFKNLFTSSNPMLPAEFRNLFDCSISDSDNQFLCAMPTDSEIYDFLLSLERTKAPKPDGFTALFYVKYWNHIKGTVLNAVGDFFMHNILLREQNHTFIALIPKKLGASSVHQFRPISLCNFIYKIISKLLANRLKPLLDKVISPFQTAFVPG